MTRTIKPPRDGTCPLTLHGVVVGHVTFKGGTCEAKVTSPLALAMLKERGGGISYGCEGNGWPGAELVLGPLRGMLDGAPLDGLVPVNANQRVLKVTPEIQAAPDEATLTTTEPLHFKAKP